ncbi:major facilitator superfamily domain-containing protein [Echria macrotheca]|uniref:Major facilitator superfamily domain-containing protein n=1 Tax=Echria macrotheca TaxID=438768 RepID=A0AAJ0F7G9_9PEZI|nr:major facilitator superfamily domain-containing protein [Echria macrotheca]
MRLYTWRNIFFFEGIITCLCGLAAPIWMPNKPGDCKFLTERQRMIAAERLIREHRVDEDEQVTWADVRRAMLCIHNYTCAFGFFLINITVQGLSVFLPTIIKDLNPTWTNTQTQLYSVPPYVAACAIAVAIAYVSDKTKQRGIYLAIFSLIALSGFCVMRWSSDSWTRYGGIFLITVGAFPGGPGFLSWGINNSAGPAVRAVSTAYIVSLGTIGGIVSTWTYMPTDAPKYPIGHTINIAGQAGTFVLAVFGILYCYRENRLRAAGKRDHRLEGLSEHEQQKLGYRHPRFKYWT